MAVVYVYLNVFIFQTGSIIVNDTIVQSDKSILTVTCLTLYTKLVWKKVLVNKYNIYPNLLNFFEI